MKTKDVFNTQIRRLMRRWKKNDWSPPSLPEELSGLLKEWREHLNVYWASAYCAAVGALIRGLLLDSSTKTEEATGRIESSQNLPRFCVFARPGSFLAHEEKLDQEGVNVCIDTGQFAHQIAHYCGVSELWGELAWLSIAASLVETGADNVLPRLEIHKSRNGIIEVSLGNTRRKRKKI